jgi:hypothetical protein
MAIVAVNQMAAEFRAYCVANDKRHEATDKSIEDIKIQLSEVSDALRSAAALCNTMTGNIFHAPTMAPPPPQHSTQRLGWR